MHEFPYVKQVILMDYNHDHKFIMDTEQQFAETQNVYINVKANNITKNKKCSHYS